MDGWNTIFILDGLFPGIMLVSGRVGLESFWKVDLAELKFWRGYPPENQHSPSKKDGWKTIRLPFELVHAIFFVDC